MDEPRRIPIHRSLNRSNLMMGGDRELVLMSMLVAAVVVFTAGTLVQAGLGVTLWLLLHAGLVQMGRADPHMREIYIRQVNYRAFYAAQSGADCVPLSPPEWKD